MFCIALVFTPSSAIIMWKYPAKTSPTISQVWKGSVQQQKWLGSIVLCWTAAGPWLERKYLITCAPCPAYNISLFWSDWAPCVVLDRATITASHLLTFTYQQEITSTWLFLSGFWLRRSRSFLQEVRKSSPTSGSYTLFVNSLLSDYQCPVGKTAFYLRGKEKWQMVGGKRKIPQIEGLSSKQGWDFPAWKSQFSCRHGLLLSSVAFSLKQD